MPKTFKRIEIKLTENKLHFSKADGLIVGVVYSLQEQTDLVEQLQESGAIYLNFSGDNKAHFVSRMNETALRAFIRELQETTFINNLKLQLLKPNGIAV